MEDQNNSTSPVVVEQPPMGDSPVGAVPAPGQGAEKAVDQKTDGATPAPKTYSEADWNKRQSALDKRMEQLESGYKTQLETTRQELADAQARLDEASTQAFLNTIEKSGGDMDVARTLAQRQQASVKLERDLKARRAELDAKAALLSEAGKGKSAHDLIAQYSLDKDCLDDLLESKTEVEMKAKALEIHVNNLQTALKNPVKTDSSVGSGTGADLSKMPETLRLGNLMG